MYRRSGKPRRALRWIAGAVTAVAVSGALVACGSDDGGSASGASTDTSAPDATASAPSDTSAPSRTESGGETTTAAHTSDPDGDAVSGGSLTYLHMTATRGFDPAVGQVNSQFSMQNFAVYDMLAHELPTGGVELRLLASGESSDAVTWTLTLKPDVMFSDGTPLDAEAVKFNWERLANPETGAVAASTAQSIETMEVIDPTTLEVTLAEPNGQFLRTIATSALTWIGSPTAIQADPDGFNTQPVGAGPYLLKEWVPDSQSVFERNPEYYGTTHVDEFTVKIITDEAQRLSALQSGEGDVMFTVNGVTAGQGEDAGFDVNATSPGGGYVMFFNTQRAPFDDVKVRRAFALALDGQELSDTVYNGTRTVASNAFPESSPFYDERFDQPEPDDAETQRLFDEIAAERGEPLEVTLSYVATFTPEAEWFQAKISSFDNVNVELEVTPSAEYQATYSAGDVEFGMFSYPILDPVDLADRMATDGPLNYAQISDPEIDAAFADGVAALDEQERIEIYTPVLQTLVDEVPFTFFLRQEAWEFYDSDKVHGIGPDSQLYGSGLMMITEVWVTE